MIAAGELHISSAVVAEKLGLDPVLTRKDLAMAGVTGKPRRGYPAQELQNAINAALGWDNTTDAVLVGVGSLGNALLGYSGFEEQNLSIAVAFDANPGMLGLTLHGVKVRPMEDLPRLVVLPDTFENRVNVFYHCDKMAAPPLLCKFGRYLGNTQVLIDTFVQKGVSPL